MREENGSDLSGPTSLRRARTSGFQGWLTPANLYYHASVTAVESRELVPDISLSLELQAGMKLTITTSELQALKRSYFWGWVKALPNERCAVERLLVMGFVATRHAERAGPVEFAITPLGCDVLKELEYARES